MVVFKQPDAAVSERCEGGPCKYSQFSTTNESEQHVRYAQELRRVETAT